MTKFNTNLPINNTNKNPSNSIVKGALKNTGSTIAFDKGIVVKGVTKYFGDKKVLNKISLVLHQDNINTIIGSSGAGKTTLFRCIAGLETIDEGEIYINGILVSSPTVHVEPSKRNVGVVFQDFALFPHMNAIKNITYGMKQGTKTQKYNEALKYLDIVNLSEHSNQKPGSMSGGQQQRLALARTLASHPKYILFDEAFNAFDMKMKEDIRIEIMTILRQLNISPIFITHNQHEAFGWSTNVALLNDGQILQQGTPEELYFEPNSNFVASHVGATTVIKGRIVKDNYIQTEIGDFVSEKPVFRELFWQYKNFALRPESFRLDREGQFVGELVATQFEGTHYGLTIKCKEKLLHIHSIEIDGAKIGDMVRFTINEDRIIFIENIPEWGRTSKRA